MRLRVFHKPMPIPALSAVPAELETQALALRHFRHHGLDLLRSFWSKFGGVHLPSWDALDGERWPILRWRRLQVEGEIGQLEGVGGVGFKVVSYRARQACVANVTPRTDDVRRYLNGECSHSGSGGEEGVLYRESCGGGVISGSGGTMRMRREGRLATERRIINPLLEQTELRNCGGPRLGFYIRDGALFGLGRETLQESVGVKPIVRTSRYV